MAKYAVSEEGVQALKLVALKVIEGTEEIKEETVRMTQIADQYRDTLGPHRDELENVLMEIKGAFWNGVMPAHDIADRLNEVAEGYQDVIGTNRFRSSGN